MLWRRAWQSTPVFLPGESHGQRSLVDYSAWGCKRVRHDSITKHMYVLSSNQMDTKIDLKSLKTMFNKEQNAIEWIWTSEWNGLYSNPSPSLLALRCSVAYLLSASVQKKKKEKEKKSISPSEGGYRINQAYPCKATNALSYNASHTGLQTLSGCCWYPGVATDLILQLVAGLGGRERWGGEGGGAHKEHKTQVTLAEGQGGKTSPGCQGWGRCCGEYVLT